MNDGDTSAFWDSQADSFDDEFDHGLTTAAAKDAWRTLLVSLLPSSPCAVADLGCGTGTLSLLLAHTGYQVTGMDLSEVMLDRARRKASDEQTVVDFCVGDVSDPPLHHGTFEVALARHVVWALPDPATALAAWRGLLRPGGRLVLIEGCWSTGAGLTSPELIKLVEPLAQTVKVQQLQDASLWGREIADERFVLVANF
ncbi:MAG TPA: class I SAM-dependent methyltransferase [Actinomycetes bacterium]|nr:class I SAM-dependent methyltransferase [Actinomycetes bacterium]